MEIRGRSFQIPEGKLGAFTLDQPVLNQIGGDKALPLKPDQQQAIQAAYAGGKKLSIVDGGIYLGWNPSSPAIGDYRINYELAPLGAHQRDRPAAGLAVPGLPDRSPATSC